VTKKLPNSTYTEVPYAWKPQEGPQLDALLATWCPELLFGGARGGGKSQLLLGDFLQDVEKFGQHWKGILFRRSYKELEELIDNSKLIYPKSGGEYYIQAKEWRWPNGAKLRFAYLERDADAEGYQGHQYTWLGFDELGNYPSDGPYKKLIACLRNGDMEIPTKRIRASANPGGSGHHWVYDRFISHAPKGYEPYDDPISGMTRMFIPSRVTDNLILMKNDPGYVGRLRNVGSEALVKAWLEGDWSAIEGAFFSEFKPGIHVIDEFSIPDYWPKWAAVDWGFAKPFSVGWYTISDSSMEDDGLPSGSIIRYKEWYGCGEPNKGIRLPVDKFAHGIRERTGSDHLEYVVCDPSMFVEDGGPSLAEHMGRAPYNLPVIRGDNKRVPGWNRARVLMNAEKQRPKCYFFPSSIHLLRTLPIMQHDKKKSEDLDTTSEDHAVDEWRYSIMSRIDPRNKPEPGYRPIHGIEKLTLQRLWKYHEEEQGKQKRF
jgi:hypothetical protein